MNVDFLKLRFSRFGDFVRLVTSSLAFATSLLKRSRLVASLLWMQLLQFKPEKNSGFNGIWTQEQVKLLWVYTPMIWMKCDDDDTLDVNT